MMPLGGPQIRFIEIKFASIRCSISCQPTFQRVRLRRYIARQASLARL